MTSGLPSSLPTSSRARSSCDRCRLSSISRSLSTRARTVGVAGAARPRGNRKFRAYPGATVRTSPIEPEPSTVSRNTTFTSDDPLGVSEPGLPPSWSSATDPTGYLSKRYRTACSMGDGLRVDVFACAWTSAHNPAADLSDYPNHPSKGHRGPTHHLSRAATPSQSRTCVRILSNGCSTRPEAGD